MDGRGMRALSGTADEVKGERLNLMAGRSGAVGVGTGDIEAQSRVEQMASGVEQADADDVVALLAAFASEIDGGG